MGILDKVKKDAAAKVPAKVDASKAPAKKTTATAKVVTASNGVILHPVLSEKSTMQEAGGQYTFVVSADASKVDVKKDVEALYGVLPVRVNMINVEGKRVRFGRYKGRRSDRKKAIVTLPKGKKIDIHEGV